MSDDARLYGVIAEFTDPHQLVSACEKVRDAGFRHWDAHTPFPIHGMDAAMGIRGTRLPWIVLGGGLSGLGLALLMIWWMNGVDYPYVISGKPLFGLPAAIPITFELTVLCSAFAAFFGMWLSNGLPRLSHPLFSSERFQRATADRFYISIEARDPRYRREETGRFLAGLGAVAVEEVHDLAKD